MNHHPVRATVLALVAMACSLLALLGFLTRGAWLWQCLGLVLLVGLVMAATRAVRIWLPGPAGLVTVIGYVTACCTPRDALVWIIPTPTSVGALLDQLVAAGDAIKAQPPFDPHPEVFTPVLLIATGLATLVAVALAADLGWPALAGIPLVAPWIVLSFVRFAAAFPPIAAAGAAYALLLAWGSRGGARQPPRAWPLPAVVAGLAGAIVAPLVVVPLSQQTPAWGALRDRFTVVADALGGSAVAPGASVDLGLSLLRDLRQNAALVLLTTTPLPGADGTVATDGAERLRITSRYDFDGESWANPAGAWDEVEDRYLWPDPDAVAQDAGGVWTGAETAIQVEVGDYDQPDGRVPVTIGPRWLTGLDYVEYNAAADAVRTRPALASGEVYTLTTQHLDRTVLASLAVDVADAPAASLNPGPLDHLAELQALADAITADAPTDYAKVQALLAYFRQAGFTYSLNVSYTGADPLWDFLQRQAGWCIHYATAFVILARLAGLPARLGVGFTAGTVVDPATGTREIRGSNSHAWPEVLFEDAGWVAFEPTPGFADPEPGPAAAGQSTAAPSATPSQGAGAAPSAGVTPGAAQPSAAATAGAAAGAAVGEAWAAYGGWLALAGLVVATVAGVLGRRSYRRRHATLDEVWSEQRDLALRDGLVARGATVHEVGEALAARFGPGPAAEAGRHLARLVEQARYSPPDAITVAATVDSEARADRDVMRRARR
ncbi:MAG: transglutaminase-like domain-containing protein [Propionibacteriaceae bacterium]|jgi:transglutaminase-like putative cysteine protease|nr:transglutaminase-like domain-containing protein [Propionibacteriaceae bacterium]